MSDGPDGAARAEAAAEKRRRAHRTRLLKASELELARTAGGFLTLKVRGGEEPERYERISAFRAFPLSAADHYISLRDREDDEIGIVESLDDLTPEQAALVRDELDRRYFTPLIERVESLKEEFGYSYWTVHTDAGRRRFTVQSGKNTSRWWARTPGDRRRRRQPVRGGRLHPAGPFGAAHAGRAPVNGCLMRSRP